MRVDRQWRIVFPSLSAAGICAHCEPIGVACRESALPAGNPTSCLVNCLASRKRKHSKGTEFSASTEPVGDQ